MRAWGWGGQVSQQEGRWAGKDSWSRGPMGVSEGRWPECAA